MSLLAFVRALAIRTALRVGKYGEAGRLDRVPASAAQAVGIRWRARCLCAALDVQFLALDDARGAVRQVSHSRRPRSGDATR